MFQFISVFLHYLVQVLVRSAINQYSFSFLEYFSFSKRIAIILVLVLVMKTALLKSAI